MRAASLGGAGRPEGVGDRWWRCALLTVASSAPPRRPDVSGAPSSGSGRARRAACPVVHTVQVVPRRSAQAPLGVVARSVVPRARCRADEACEPSSLRSGCVERRRGLTLRIGCAHSRGNVPRCREGRSCAGPRCCPTPRTDARPGTVACVEGTGAVQCAVSGTATSRSRSTCGGCSGARVPRAAGRDPPAAARVHVVSVRARVGDVGRSVRGPRLSAPALRTPEYCRPSPRGGTALPRRMCTGPSSAAIVCEAG